VILCGLPPGEKANGSESSMAGGGRTAESEKSARPGVGSRRWEIFRYTAGGLRQAGRVMPSRGGARVTTAKPGTGASKFLEKKGTLSCQGGRTKKKSSRVVGRSLGMGADVAPL